MVARTAVRIAVALVPLLAAVSAAPAHASFSPSGPFTLENSSGIKWTIGNGFIACDIARVTGSMPGGAGPIVMSVNYAFFSNCQPWGTPTTVTCSGASDGTLRLERQTSTQAIARLAFNANACLMTLPSCTITWPSPSSSSTNIALDLPSPTKVYIPAFTSTYAASGGACGSYGIAPTGTANVTDLFGNDLLFTQTGGTAITWS